jgi:hypothetical protein
MTLEEFEAEAKAAMVDAKAWAENLWNALPPEFQHPALDAAKAGVADLGTLAVAEVAKSSAPASAQAVLDDAIDAVDAKAESAIAVINNKAAADKAALVAAKEAVGS